MESPPTFGRDPTDLSASNHTRGFLASRATHVRFATVSARMLSLEPMETPQTKNEIIQAIQDLPDDATLEDAMERLYFLAKIERGLAQSDAGDTISHAEIKARFQR
jgi:predicted transcriptional regulator